MKTWIKNFLCQQVIGMGWDEWVEFQHASCVVTSQMVKSGTINHKARRIMQIIGKTQPELAKIEFHGVGFDYKEGFTAQNA
jgi:hypothetical protein